jgi:hypothetical protein
MILVRYPLFVTTTLGVLIVFLVAVGGYRLGLLGGMAAFAVPAFTGVIIGSFIIVRY